MKRKHAFIIISLFFFIASIKVSYANVIVDKNNLSNSGDNSYILGGNRVNQEKIVTNNKSFALPASLAFIDENAFDGTAFSSIYLPNTIERIGDFAFSNMKSLKWFMIPCKTVFIGDNVLSGSNQVTIISADNSKTKEWAKTNDIPFLPIKGLYIDIQAKKILGKITESQYEKYIFYQTEIEEELVRSARINNELQTIGRQKIYTYRQLSRSPPNIENRT